MNTPKFGNLVALALLSAALGACSSAPVKKEIKPNREAGEYERLKASIENSDTIAPGYTLRITHSADSTISGEYEVNFDGNIKLPYKVSVRAAGVGPQSLGAKIAEAYTSYFKGQNKVNVEIKKKALYVEVRGEVQKPGRFLVRVDTSLEELVSQAGGFMGSGQNGTSPSSAVQRPDFLRIERRDFKSDQPAVSWFALAEYFSRYDTDPEFLWRGGERIIFQKTAPSDANIRTKWQTITVMGEVKDPKEHPMIPHADLLTYVTRSGGPTAQADLAAVEIIRRSEDVTETYSLTTDNRAVKLSPGDVVLVRAISTRPSFFERTLTYIQVATGIATSILLILLL